MDKEKKEDVEIDLLELGSKTVNGIGKGFSNLYAFIVRFLTGTLYFFLRNGILFTIIIVVGVIAGGVTYKLKKQFYHSEMIAYSSISANSEIIKSVNNWNYAREFSKEDAEKIKDVYASFLIDVNGDGKWDIIEGMETVNELDTTLGLRVNGVFAVMIEVYDTSMVMPIKEKLMKFLFSNEKVERRNKERLIELDRLQAKIGEQLSLLDSLQKYEYYKEDDPSIMPAPGDNNMFILQKKDKRLYHENILDLYKQQIELKRQIAANPDPYDVRVDFEVPRKGSVTIIREIGINVIVFFIIGFIIVFLRDRWKIIKRNIEQAEKEKL